MTFPAFLKKQLRHRGFTLVELLVAMGVLTAVTLMVTTLVSNVSKTTAIGTRSIETDNVSRFFFTRLGADIDNMIVRSDVNYLFEKLGDDDAIGFLAAQPGSTLNPSPSAVASTRPVSRVYYRRLTGGEISRANVSTADANWTSPIFAAAPTLINATNFGLPDALAQADLVFQGFGAEIIRMEFTCLVSGNGGLTPYMGVPANINDIKAIVVAIAVMDDATMQRLTSTEIDSLAGELLDSNEVDIIAGWRANLAVSANQQAAAGVRLYQRTFLLPR